MRDPFPLLQELRSKRNVLPVLRATGRQLLGRQPCRNVCNATQAHSRAVLELRLLHSVSLVTRDIGRLTPRLLVLLVEQDCGLQ